MKTKDLNILMIGSDPRLDIAYGGDETESLKRHLRYASYVNKIVFISPVIFPSGNNQHCFYQKNNLFVYLVRSRFRLMIAFKAFMRGRRLYKKHQINLIIAQDPLLWGLIGLAWKRLFQGRLLINEWGMIDDEYAIKEKFWDRLKNSIARYVLKNCDGIRVDSKRTAERLKKYGKTAIIPVINLEATRYVPKRTKTYKTVKREGKENKNIVCPARLELQKNLTMLIEAFSILKDRYSRVKLFILGGGSQIYRLLRLTKINGLQDRIIFTGDIPLTECYDYINKSHIVVLPSNYEGFPKVIYEALFFGKPIVMTDVGSAGELTREGENAFIVPISDKEKFADKIEYLLKNPVEYERMSLNARKTGEEFFRKAGELDKALIRFWEEVALKR